MKGVYLQKNSPFYWIRYYDKYEQNTSKKRKSVNTKIPATQSDLQRFTSKQPLQGTPQLRTLLREFKQALANRNIELQSGASLRHNLTLSQGYSEYKLSKSIPGSNNSIKNKTIKSYTLAVDHLVNACGDKKIYKYSSKDYEKLLYYFEEKGLSNNSRAIYTRSLHAIWNYFVNKNYSQSNIIEVISQQKKPPESIPLDEMQVILESLKKNKRLRHQYFFVNFMLQTGCRPSSAMVQLKEDIDYSQKIIKIQNVKTGIRKGNPYYRYPLHDKLINLLKEMKVKPGQKGRLFSMYREIEGNYTSPLSFWKRKIRSLVKSGEISQEYTIKQIRPTHASYLINVLKMDIFTVQKLLDHADIKTTDKHYIDFNLEKVRNLMNSM